MKTGLIIFNTLAVTLRTDTGRTQDIVPHYSYDKLTGELKRGAGFWKFNTSLLKDDRYVKLTEETIHETVF